MGGRVGGDEMIVGGVNRTSGIVDGITYSAFERGVRCHLRHLRNPKSSRICINHVTVFVRCTTRAVGINFATPGYECLTKDVMFKKNGLILC